MKLTEKTKHIIRQLPDKKRYLDFFTAVLTVPILLTVIFSNITNLQSNKKTEISPTPTQVVVISPEPLLSIAKEYPTSKVLISPTVATVSATPTIHTTTTASQSPTPTSTPFVCKKQVGPVSIVKPAENQVVTTDPLCFDIQYNDTNYCSVVWSYRINGGGWSEFIDSDICLLNVASGEKKIELKVKSTVSNDETTIVRTIIYKNPNEAATPTPTKSPDATSSAIFIPNEHS